MPGLTEKNCCVVQEGVGEDLEVMFVDASLSRSSLQSRRWVPPFFGDSVPQACCLCEGCIGTFPSSCCCAEAEVALLVSQALHSPQIKLASLLTCVSALFACQPFLAVSSSRHLLYVQVPS